MKRSLILLTLMLSVVLNLNAKPRVIESPVCYLNCFPDLKINKVVFDKKATVLHLSYKGQKGSWWKYQKSAYLKTSDGKIYPVLEADGIQLDSLNWPKKDGWVNFSLSFKSLPKKIQSFDLIETKYGGFNIFGIHDKSETIDMPSVNDSIESITDYEKFFVSGKSTLVGKFNGKHPDYIVVSSGYNLLSWEPSTTVVPVEEDGTFTKVFEIDYPHFNTINIEGYDYAYYLEPGKTTRLLIDEDQIATYSEDTPNKNLMDMLAFTNFSESEGQLNIQKCSNDALRYLAFDFNLNPKEYQLLKRYKDCCGFYSSINDLVIGRNGSMESLKTFDFDDLSYGYWSEIMSSEVNNYIFLLRERSNNQNNIGLVEEVLLNRLTPSSLLMLRQLSKADMREAYRSSPEIYNKIFDNQRMLITVPFIRSRFEKNLKDVEEESKLITLSDTDDREKLFKSLVSKYKGKHVVVNFWSMGNNTSRYLIEQSALLRQKLSKLDDVKLIFVAAEYGSKEKYDKYVDKYLKGEDVHLLKEVDFSKLVSLFKFNVIPHTVEVLTDGRVNMYPVVEIDPDMPVETFVNSFYKPIQVAAE